MLHFFFQSLLPAKSLYHSVCSFTANETCESDPSQVYGPLNPGLFSDSVGYCLHIQTKNYCPPPPFLFFPESANFSTVSMKQHCFPSFPTLCRNIYTLYKVGKILASVTRQQNIQPKYALYNTFCIKLSTTVPGNHSQ